MKQKDLKKRIKIYTFETVILICAFIITIFFLVDKSFSKRLITNFEIFRPEKTFILMIAFGVFTIFLFLMLLAQSRQKKLKSTKRKSKFAETLELSHKIRELSVTQVVRTESSAISYKENIMPRDITITNLSVVDFYFTYEEKLNI